MSAPARGQEGQNGQQMAPKANRRVGQMGQAAARDQADNVNERSTTSMFSYSDFPYYRKLK
jgi:hypothetical protein